MPTTGITPRVAGTWVSAVPATGGPVWVRVLAKRKLDQLASRRSGLGGIATEVYGHRRDKMGVLADGQGAACACVQDAL